MPDPFVSRQDLSDMLGRDVTDDYGALIAVDAACDVCRTVAETVFNRATSTELYDGSGTDALPLRQRPVVAVSAVTVGDVAVTEFTWNRRTDVLLRGLAGVWPRAVWPHGRQNVSVTYTHGYGEDDVPADVRAVALSIAQRLVVQGPAIQETLGDSSVRYAVPALDLTNGERWILQKYRSIR